MKKLSIFTSLLAASVLLVAAGCSSSGKTSPILEGTTVAGIPPVPVTLAPLLHVAETRISDDCRGVVGGIQNCEVLLQRKASSQLIGVVSRTMARELQDRETREQGGEAGAGYAVDGAYVEQVTRKFLAEAQLRELPSPLFHLGSEKAYVMRMVLVREEADFNIWEDLLDRAKAGNRERVARSVQTLLKEKYKEKGPSRSEIEKTERKVAEHYQTMWDQAASPKAKR